MERKSLATKIRNANHKEFGIWIDINTIGITGKTHPKHKRFSEFTYVVDGIRFRSYFTYIDDKKTKIFIVWQREEIK